MKCIVRINRAGVKLSASEINAMLNTVKGTGAEVDGYTIYPNVIRIRIYSDITPALCKRIEERMLQTFERIIEKRRAK